jgi:transcriptional regulator with PAS, ATPase and Fis domain
MRDVYAVMKKVTQGDANVYIEGENGTGKELIAQALHSSGPRRDRPFITLDCAAIPEGLMESHIFGHVRGAFTGAVSTRPGVFALAHTGTFFIDEIGELAPHLQAKLLRVIQNREFTMVGGAHPRRVDVRLITATNRDLRKAIREGGFREDLYYRMAVVHINLPPLRERKEDIPLLIAHFLRLKGLAYRKNIQGLTSRAMEALMAYSWPGNVRELENWIEQAVVLVDGDLIDNEHFPCMHGEGVEVSLRRTPQRLRLRELEKLYILDTLQQTHGNRSKAARLLGISVRGLQYKLQRYVDKDAGVRNALASAHATASGGRQSARVASEILDRIVEDCTLEGTSRGAREECRGHPHT